MGAEQDSTPIRDLLGSELLIKGVDGKPTSSSLSVLDGKYIGGEPLGG